MVLVQPGAKERGHVAAKRSPIPLDAVATREPPMCPAFSDLLPSLTGTAFRSQTYERFITEYAPHAVESWPRLPTNLQVIPSTSWLQAAIAVASTDAVLNNALTALALTQAGRKTKQPDMIMCGQRLYTEALSGLNRRLKSGSESLTATTLATASTLTLYEV